MQNLNPFIQYIQEVCKLNGVKTLYAFGSVLTERFGDESDVDLIVDLEEKDPIEYTEKYFNVKFDSKDDF